MLVLGVFCNRGDPNEAERIARRVTVCRIFHIKQYIMQNNKEFAYKALHNPECMQSILIIWFRGGKPTAWRVCDRDLALGCRLPVPVGVGCDIVPT